MTIEGEVREMLERRAASVTPRPGARDARLGEPAGAGGRGHRVALAAAAALVVVAAVGAGLAVRDDPTSVRADGDTTTATTAPHPAVVPASPPQGVWPWPDDPVPTAAVDDPVRMARAYVDFVVRRAGGTGISPVTTVSEFQAGDANSGEVVFGGDITTTVFVRRLGGRWHVEGSASDLVTMHDAGDGTVTARVEEAGLLLHDSSVWTSAETHTSADTQQREAGYEVPGLGYDMNTDRAVKSERFVLRMENPVANPPTSFAISEARFAPPLP